MAKNDHTLLFVGGAAALAYYFRAQLIPLLPASVAALIPAAACPSGVSACTAVTTSAAPIPPTPATPLQQGTVLVINPPAGLIAQQQNPAPAPAASNPVADCLTAAGYPGPGFQTLAATQAVFARCNAQGTLAGLTPGRTVWVAGATNRNRRPWTR